MDDNRNDLKPLEEQDLMNWTQVWFPLELIVEPIEQQFMISCRLQNKLFYITTSLLVKYCCKKAVVDLPAIVIRYLIRIQVVPHDGPMCDLLCSDPDDRS